MLRSITGRPAGQKDTALNAQKQRRILNALAPNFARDGETEAAYLQRTQQQITEFIEKYLESARAEGAVIGISGGIDSFLVGALLAENFRKTKKRLIAVMLPNGVQADLEDAEACAARIRDIYPETEIETLNIGSAYEACVTALRDLGTAAPDLYTLGNLQPRLRMVYQYALAKNMLVAGTDHASEAVTGFYTKYGDGGVDFNPIGQMIKDDIYALSGQLGAPEAVMKKQPAAGIGISADDESELKLTYKDICAFLKGHPVSAETEERLIGFYDRSAHKRTVPPTPSWLYREQVPVTHIHCGGVSENIADECLSYMQENPDEMVLYVGEAAPVFHTALHKTVNTPITRYNCFSAETLENPFYGSLTENAEQTVVLTGNSELADDICGLLDEEAAVTFVEDCIE